MVLCSKCSKVAKTTSLATPGVKKKNEMYLGSPAGSSKSTDKSKTSSTLGNNGIGKVWNQVSCSRPSKYMLIGVCRASSCQKPHGIPTLHIRVLAPHARRR